MLSDIANASEYEPLSGSSGNPDRKRAYMMGGGAAFLCFSLFVLSGSSGVVQHNVVPSQMAAAGVDVAQPQPAGPGPMSKATVGSETVEFTTTQYDLVYNILSFAIACMGSATVFFFFQFSLVDKQYRTAMVITSLVTLIAFYHYIRIFNSFTDAYTDQDGKITATGVPFNDAYRYVDWLLTVPLLLTELILVMNLEPDATRSNCLKLGGAAALMIVLGYPGEVSASMGTRWLFWALAMVPFVYIVWTLFVGLSESVADQPERARGLVNGARWVTVLSWCTYPIVYILPMLGVSGASARTGIQLGYSIADVIAKPLLGLMVWQIAKRKSKA
jgi:bacteriorhodopsin